jgi:LacI family transcriptional regulator
LRNTVKIDDVARLAGVSAKTVSRVLNGEAHVRNQKREAVDRAIAALGYRPNLAARSLASSRSFVVGVISPCVENFRFYYHELHSRTIRACRERGLHLIVEEVNTRSRDLVPHLEHSLRQMHFEGVILTSPVSDSAKVLDLLDRLGIRYVRISPTTHASRSDSVSADYVQAAALLAEHLWNLGHRRIAIAFVNTRGSNPLKNALVKLGGDPKQIQILPLDLNQAPIDAGRDVAAALLSQRNPPTAVFAFNDAIAAGLIGYALEHDVSVPRDLSVAGFDDGDVAQATWPPLTTLRQPLDEMARAAVSLLVKPTIDGKIRKIICPVQLIVRGSTGRVRTSKRPRHSAARGSS